MYQQQKTKKTFKVDFSATFEKLKEKLDSFRTVLPSSAEGGKPVIKEAVKQSVASTAQEIYRLLLSNNRKSKRGSLALKTKVCSLARTFRCSERTVRRHIQKLIELGLIYAKNRLGHGIQLVLNASIAVFTESEMAEPPVPAHPPQAPPGTTSVARALADAAANALSKFTKFSPPAPS